jgi:rRNA maturation RNase YbeY
MISFHNEDVTFRLKEKAKLKSWIESVLKKHKRKAGEISYVFCSDGFLLDMNQKYLDHDTYTDIITFDYSKGEPGGPVSGEIFISIDRVRENADAFGKTFENELHRVMIHGVLHILGFGDKTKKAKEEMRKQEDLCLKALKKA